MRLRELFLTFFYIGKVPVASGTVASFVAIFPALLILEFLPQSSLFLLSFLIFAIAIKQIDIYEKEIGEHDTKEIVIDEVAGMWLAISLVGSGILQTVLAFFAFRLFDVWKPSIIGKVDRDVSGGLGVMGDDMLAGVFGGILASLIMLLIQKLGVL